MPPFKKCFMPIPHNASYMPKAGPTPRARTAGGRLQKLIEKIDAGIRPSKSELAAEKEFASKVISSLSGALPDAKIVFIGSAARDTGLRGERDIDIFVAFPRTLSEGQIVDRTFAAARKAARAEWVRHYAEHPYLQAQVAGFHLEVIPCFQMSPNEPLKSAVDRSPLHMAYLQSRLSQGQRRDVRVLKKLLKAAGIYGAESRVCGFSGFVCELLVLNYRTLPLLLQAASKWRVPIIVDINGQYKQDDRAVAAAFPGAPLVVVDPTDKGRNAAAAISLENVARFILLSRALLSAPSENFFFPKKAGVSKEELAEAMKRRGTHFICFRCPRPAVVEDILYPQMRKTYGALHAQFSRSGLSPVSGAYFEDGKSALFLLELPLAQACPLKISAGPPAFDWQSVEKFMSSRKAGAIRGPYVRADGRVAVEHFAPVNAGALAKEFLKAPASRGVASHFQGPMKKAKVAEGAGRICKSVSRGALSFIADHVLKKEGWA